MINRAPARLSSSHAGILLLDPFHSRLDEQSRGGRGSLLGLDCEAELEMKWRVKRKSYQPIQLWRQDGA